MVKSRITPTLRLVATLARLRQVHGLMIRPLGRLVVLFMACKAVGVEFAAQFVARSARDRGMGSGQGEFFVMIFGCFQLLVPPHNGMALFAIVSPLPPVNVRMTVVTFLSDIREDEICVAEGTFGVLMQAS